MHWVLLIAAALNLYTAYVVWPKPPTPPPPLPESKLVHDPKGGWGDSKLFLYVRTQAGYEEQVYRIGNFEMLSLNLYEKTR